MSVLSEVIKLASFEDKIENHLRWLQCIDIDG